MTFPDPVAIDPASESNLSAHPRRALGVTALILAIITFILGLVESTSGYLTALYVDPSSRIIEHWVSGFTYDLAVEIFTARNAAIPRLFAFLTSIFLGIGSLHRPGSTFVSGTAIGVAITGLLGLLVEAILALS